LLVPTDILLLILDYVALRIDLKALCQVSKHFYELAVPLLYREVYVTTWDNEQRKLKQFSQCMASGANIHLRHTRSLISEGTVPPMEPRLEPELPPPKQFTNEVEYDQYHRVVTSLRLRLLDTFLENGLHTFQ
jgi:hypothetical protein